jgi:drug/metabolite transporter (DMT)-like permease
MLAMRHTNLASIAVAYSILTILLLAVLGTMAFREIHSTRELIGIVFACVALALMSRSA